MCSGLMGQDIFKRELILMGSEFGITVVAENSSVADGYISDAIQEISRIESLISSWDSHSQTTAINDNAGIEPARVDRELFDQKLS